MCRMRFFFWPPKVKTEPQFRTSQQARIFCGIQVAWGKVEGRQGRKKQAPVLRRGANKNKRKKIRQTNIQEGVNGPSSSTVRLLSSKRMLTALHSYV